MVPKNRTRSCHCGIRTYYNVLFEEQFPNVVFEPILSCKCFFNSINKINAFKNLRNQLVAA